MNEKKCKQCTMMIPKEAKICPHCRKRQGWTWPAKIFLGLILLSVMMPVFVGSNKTHSPAPIVQEEPLSPKGQNIKKLYPGWSNDVCNTVSEEKIKIGMTEEQVIAAWGKPYKINTTRNSYGSHDQWVMHDSIDSSYLYFDNGILKSIQQSK